MSLPDELTSLLQLAAQGDIRAKDRVASVVYDQLHNIARRRMSGERFDHTLQPTALVNEAWQELIGENRHWENRTHFYAVASQIMRRLLIDHARKVKAAKRGYGRKTELTDLTVPSSASPEEWLALDEALTRLAQLDVRQAKVVELRFFGGLTESEIAELLQLSVRTVRRDWIVARLWLQRELTQ